MLSFVRRIWLNVSWGINLNLAIYKTLWKQ